MKSSFLKINRVFLTTLIVMLTWTGTVTAEELKIGDKAPDFSLPNAQGQERNLYDLLAEGPVVISFYRGGWCPYCNDQLYAYQEKLAEIEAMGAQLVAISPEKPQSMVDTVLSRGLTFEVLSDTGNKVIREYGLIWNVTEKDRIRTERFVKEKTGATLAEYNGIEHPELPIPATYVISQEGVITYAFVNENYKERAPLPEVLAAIDSVALIQPAAQ